MLCRNAKARGKHCENGPNVTPYPTTITAYGLGNILHSRRPYNVDDLQSVWVRAFLLIINLAVILIHFIIQTKKQNNYPNWLNINKQ